MALPKREGFRLTAQADKDAADFIAGDYGCSCHICAPCSGCTHPGNPIALEEDDSCWEVDPDYLSA